MSVSRGEFLKALGKSLPGLVLGGGVAIAAQKVLGKMAAASATVEAPVISALGETAKTGGIDFIRSGPPEGNRLALTFDDGPTPGVTELILDELKRRRLHATFFMIGRHVAAAPDLARRVLAEGHEVGNHTFTHAKLTELPDRQVESEIESCQKIMADALHHRATWFRPPYGALRSSQAQILARKGLSAVLWSVDSGDWAQPDAGQIATKVLAEVKAGSIVLCHDLHRQTAESASAILDGLLEKGLACGTLSELLVSK